MNWLIDHTPWWLILAGGIVLVACLWPMLRPILTILPSPARVAIVALGAGIFAYLAGRNRGAANAGEEQKNAELHALKKRKEIEDEVAGLTPLDRDRRLNKWLRD